MPSIRVVGIPGLTDALHILMCCSLATYMGSFDNENGHITSWFLDGWDASPSLDPQKQIVSSNYRSINWQLVRPNPGLLRSCNESSLACIVEKRQDCLC